MTTLVHTADVHLRADAPERLEALEAVLDVAAERGADVVTIGGDLFDRPADVERLRPDLRNRLFADWAFEVLLLPGNHDVEAFRGDQFFGDACTVIADEEHFGSWIAPEGDLRVVGVPYQPVVTDELLLALADRDPFDGADVLCFHGSLDAPIGGDAGEESDYRYFPVTGEQLAELDFDYYLAGHYHGPHELSLEGGAEFAYPGTPASTRSSETGRRRVVVVEPGDGLSFAPLETFHHVEKRLQVAPGREDEALEELRTWAESAVTPGAEPRVVVGGVVDREESTFAEQLRAVAEPAWLTDETVGVAHVRAHPVVEEFEERLAERDLDEAEREAVLSRTLRAASEALSSGGGG